MGLKNRIRLAMTLVELMVVMAIVILFAAITAAFYPANQADRELSRFSNSVQSALLSARNRARADRLPTGIRFYADNITPSRVGSVVLIQMPAPILGSSLAPLNLSESPPSSGNYQLDLAPFQIDPLTLKRSITDGDFFVLPKGEVGQITIQPLNNPLSPAFFLKDKISSGFYSEIISANSAYKLIKGPLELTGDKPFELSDTLDIGMPVSQSQYSNPAFVFPRPLLSYMELPSGYAGLTSGSYFDILFNPNGSLLNNLQNDVFLHLRNFEAATGTAPSYSNGDYSRDAILVVRRYSGSIGVFDLAPLVDLSFPNRLDTSKNNPYIFARDPRNKGI